MISYTNISIFRLDTSDWERHSLSDLRRHSYVWFERMARKSSRRLPCLFQSQNLRLFRSICLELHPKSRQQEHPPVNWGLELWLPHLHQFDGIAELFLCVTYQRIVDSKVSSLRPLSSQETWKKDLFNWNEIVDMRNKPISAEDAFPRGVYWKVWTRTINKNSCPISRLYCTWNDYYTDVQTYSLSF